MRVIVPVIIFSLIVALAVHFKAAERAYTVSRMEEDAMRPAMYSEDFDSEELATGDAQEME